jgi:hypothetical protein
LGYKVFGKLRERVRKTQTERKTDMQIKGLRHRDRDKNRHTDKMPKAQMGGETERRADNEIEEQKVQKQG